MNETSKSRAHWGELEAAILSGKGIDIGCGGDPVSSTARGFDVEHGDANKITDYVHDEFDFVYSSHCLEHMHQPRAALSEWWKLVKVGGYLFFAVPDEDLYELGVFPSRFNPDHKATFTLSKAKSWSSLSHNVLDMARELPGAELIKLELQDYEYDRSRMRYGHPRLPFLLKVIFRTDKILQHVGLRFPSANYLLDLHFPEDQTHRQNVVAQICCILKKKS